MTSHLSLDSTADTYDDLLDAAAQAATYPGSWDRDRTSRWIGAYQRIGRAPSEYSTDDDGCQDVAILKALTPVHVKGQDEAVVGRNVTFWLRSRDLDRLSELAPSVDEPLAIAFEGQAPPKSGKGKGALKIGIAKAGPPPETDWASVRSTYGFERGFAPDGDEAKSEADDDTADVDGDIPF